MRCCIQYLPFRQFILAGFVVTSAASHAISLTFELHSRHCCKIYLQHVPLFRCTSLPPRPLPLATVACRLSLFIGLVRGIAHHFCNYGKHLYLSATN